MPAEAPELLGALPDWLRFTLQLGLVGWLILSIGALITGIVVPRHNHQREVEAERKRREYVEALRIEERAGRMAAEKRVTDLTERWDRALTLLANIEKELIRAGRERGG